MVLYRVQRKRNRKRGDPSVCFFWYVVETFQYDILLGSVVLPSNFPLVWWERFVSDNSYGSPPKVSTKTTILFSRSVGRRFLICLPRSLSRPSAYISSLLPPYGRIPRFHMPPPPSKSGRRKSSGATFFPQIFFANTIMKNRVMTPKMTFFFRERREIFVSKRVEKKVYSTASHVIQIGCHQGFALHFG